MFDANRHVLYEQSVDDIDGWLKDIESQIVTEDVGHDLTTVNLLVQKQNVLEVSQLFVVTHVLFPCKFLLCLYYLIEEHMYRLL